MMLDSKFAGRTLREWSEMTEAQRLADPAIGDKKIKQLNARIAEALAVGGTSDKPASPSIPIEEMPRGRSIAGMPGETLKPLSGKSEVSAGETISPPAETISPPAETVAAKPAAPAKPAPAPPQSLKLEDVFAAAAKRSKKGFVNRKPDAKLSAAQSELQNKLFQELTARGMKLNNQGDVYGWLLDEVAAAVLGS